MITATHRDTDEQKRQQSDLVRGTNDDVLLSRGVHNPEDFNEREHGKNDDISVENHANEDKVLRTECEHVVLAMPAKSGLCSSATDFAAERMIRNMPFLCNDIVWSTLLRACRDHRDVDRGRWAAEQMLRLDPNSAGTHITMANIYAASGRLEEVAHLRKLMKSKEVVDNAIAASPYETNSDDDEVAVTVHATNNYFVTASLDSTWCFYELSSGTCLTQVSDSSQGYTSAAFHPDGLILGTGNASFYFATTIGYAFLQIILYDFNASKTSVVPQVHLTLIQKGKIINSTVGLLGCPSFPFYHPYVLFRMQRFLVFERKTSHVELVKKNNISTIEGLRELTRLRVLDLSFNRILKNADFNNPANVICSLSFDRDEDYFASAGISKKIKIFDFNTLCNDCVDIHYPTVEMSNRSKLRCVCWNNYIKNYLASTDYDGVVKLWDASTGQEFSQYSEHEKRAWSVDFSPVCPKKFASGIDDCTVKLWSISERNCLGTIRNVANVCCVQFSAHSSHLLAFGSANYSTYCYDLRKLRAADDDVSTALHVVSSSSSLSGAASLTLTVGRLQHKGTREPARTAYCKELNSLSKAGLPPPFNVLLVCYSLFERHNPQQKDDRKILKRWKWSCVLMDEAHALKDKNRFRWKNLMSVARNAN
ncbi:hypothetical protein KIW84_070512 [Lathyrus oleraceus]|uniref:Uncharacterized protein n=1 Tax=Pisum sativum TaxID=3888 RepID=A0A9D4ZUJ6_PEA|nr:hypothetical protein KIW84_070508 [Pisum sativum]KAI5383127.1 hypothetical protein KIW84_070512 [Pisum sativum]